MPAEPLHLSSFSERRFFRGTVLKSLLAAAPATLFPPPPRPLQGAFAPRGGILLDKSMVETPRQAERVLFLPGASGDREFWKPVADRIRHPGEKVLLGWPGFGSNPTDPSIQSLNDLFESVLGLIDRPVDLVAQSMGGVLAVRAALEAPGLVRRLVLTATSGGVDVSRCGATDWREQHRRNRPSAPDWFVRDRSDFSPRLSEVKASTLLIWSDADPISPLAIGRYLVATLPRAELVVVPGADHMFARDRAEEVAPYVERHLLGA